MSASMLHRHDADPLRPRPPGGMGRGALLAIGVHVLLVLALAMGRGVQGSVLTASPTRATRSFCSADRTFITAS